MRRRKTAAPRGAATGKPDTPGMTAPEALDSTDAHGIQGIEERRALS